MRKTALEELQEFRAAWDDLKRNIIICLKKDIGNLLNWIKRIQNEQ